MTDWERLARATLAYVSTHEAIADYFKQADGGLDRAKWQELVQRRDAAEKEYVDALTAEGFFAPVGLKGTSK